ncbi:MAG: hypothetical protein QXF12_00910 [Candidatus Aenigmatarchaeota archaeon]
MKIKTSLPVFSYLKLSDKKYAFVDQDGYMKISIEDFLKFYRSVIPYIEYVEDIENEHYEKLASILPERKIIKKSQEFVQNDVLEQKEQVIVDEPKPSESEKSSNNEETEKPRRRRSSK